MNDADCIKSAVENAEFIIEQAQRRLAGPIFSEWDKGYEQGRKDAARVILLSFQDVTP